MFILKFRPSSHSDDGTVLAFFKDEETAKKVARRFAWFGGKHLKNKVKIEFVNAEYGTIGDTIEFMKNAGAKEVKQLQGYQELIIEVTLPEKMNKKTIALIYDPDTATLIEELKKVCGKPEEIITKKGRKLIFKYRGEDIFFPRNRIFPQDEFDLNGKIFHPSKVFKVKVLI